MATKLHGSVIVTYRCNAKCNMCDVWKFPTKPEEEIGLDVYEKLPDMFFTNITGGEPFVRKDLPEIVALLRKKTKRIVISTNGFFTDRIIALCEKYPDLGIRISIEGSQATNDTIRGIPEGSERTERTLLKLREMGIKDIGFAMTVQDVNAKDLVGLYEKAEGLGYEFATATLHNSHYFCKTTNRINDKPMVIGEFERLIDRLIRSNKVKQWFRAYFNYGLINYIQGNKRFLPCEMGQDGFFVDPFGDILACNGMDKKMPMGNLKAQTWDEIWNSAEAVKVRDAVKVCRKNCWMIGSAAPAIWHRPLKPMMWVAKNKLRVMLSK